MELDAASTAWVGAAALLALAIGAGVGDHLRKRRRNLDRIGLVDWPGVQIAALIGAAILASVAFHM